MARVDTEEPGQVASEDLPPDLLGDLRIAVPLPQVLGELELAQALDGPAQLRCEPGGVGAPDDAVRADEAERLAEDGRGRHRGQGDLQPKARGVEMERRGRTLMITAADLRDLRRAAPRLWRIVEAVVGFGARAERADSGLATLNRDRTPWPSSEGAALRFVSGRRDSPPMA